jgi:NitT/TauT family transport system ATP-binding protein
MSERILAAFVPLVDCAVMVAAREKGFMRERGIDFELVREPSWASLRDHLNLSYVDCAHALAPLPIASTLGVAHVEAEMVVPLVLSRGGNAITLSIDLVRDIEQAGGASAESAAAWSEGLARVVRSRDKPLTLAMVHPFSGHNFELRYWLASAGLHPDRQLRIVAIPPPLVVDSLAAGHIDGFCVGEPWSSVAVELGIGRIVATKAQIFPHGVEKVLAVRPALAGRPQLRMLNEGLLCAASWVDEPANHSEIAAILARPEYLDLSAEIIRRSLEGRLALGDGATLHDPDFLYFQRYGANAPAQEEALWIYAQMVRWGQIPMNAELQRRAAAVFRPDLYRDAAGLSNEAPASSGAAPAARVTSFDRIEFAGSDVDAYLERFALHTDFVEWRSML